MSFTTSIDRVLGSEGGYVNNPADPGGETNWGISKRSYPTLDIKMLTRDQAIAIYRTDFWQRAHCDAMPPLVAYEALDFAVNSGIQTAIRELQRAVGAAPDGYWGPVTQQKVAEMPVAELAFAFLAARLEFMASLSVWPTFGRGWARRIASLMRFAARDLRVPPPF